MVVVVKLRLVTTRVPSAHIKTILCLFSQCGLQFPLAYKGKYF